MPKLKTRKSAAKRYKISGTGKLLRRKAGRGHLQEGKSPKSKTVRKQDQSIHPTDAYKIANMLPYKNRKKAKKAHG
jgi:large subunit ribosomal protein L35